MKRFHEFYYNENYSTFHTYLPIQLDGTCNGFQHLALLSDEVDVFEELNLTEGSIYDDPRDLYSFLLNKLKTQLNKRLLDTTDEDERNCIQRLLLLDLKRSHIKALIMTKPYNATLFTLTNYLVDSLVYRGYGVLETKDGEIKLNIFDNEKSIITDKEDDDLPQEYLEFTKYITDIEDSNMKNKSSIPKSGDGCIEHNKTKPKLFYSTSLDSKHLVSREDLTYFVKEFNKIIFIHYPNIKNLMDYLSNMADILLELNLPII